MPFEDDRYLSLYRGSVTFDDKRFVLPLPHSIQRRRVKHGVTFQYFRAQKTSVFPDEGSDFNNYRTIQDQIARKIRRHIL